KKTRIPLMRAGPRVIAAEANEGSPAAREETYKHRQLRVGALRTGSGTAGFGPDASLDHWRSGDILDWRVGVSKEGLPPGIAGHTIEPGDVSVKTAAHSF